MKPGLVSTIHQLHQSIDQIDLLTVDAGNSFIKEGSFEEGTLKEINKIGPEQLKNQAKCDRIICSVRKNIRSSFTWKKATFLGAPIHYEETLGHDRLVCASHLFHVQELFKRSILLVDSGTYITLDHISSSGHSGGFIFPGPEVFLNSYSNGELLPRLVKKEDSAAIAAPTWPTSTETAIRGGAEVYLAGLTLQIEKMAHQSNSIILFTGGSSHLLESFLTSQANYESFKDLIHFSLYFTHSKNGQSLEFLK